LQHDEDLYRALAAVGIPYSSNIGLGRLQLRAGGLSAARGHVRHGVLERPALTFSTGRGI
jgi:hypothetical protein